MKLLGLFIFCFLIGCGHTSSSTLISCKSGAMTAAKSLVLDPEQESLNVVNCGRFDSDKNNYWYCIVDYKINKILRSVIVRVPEQLACPNPSIMYLERAH